MNWNQLKAGYVAFFKQKMLALLLIDKNKNFANTYDLIRVLSRMFCLFASSGIIKSIESEGYASIDKTVYDVDYYNITDLGKATLKEHKEELIIALKQVSQVKQILLYSWNNPNRKL